LAWLHQQGPDVVPIPGTKRVARLEENVGALSVQLRAEDLVRLGELQARGGRYSNAGSVGRDTPPQ
jgi:aryl-alcohol dehydrogenase-like predicted oxidoreductase